MEVCRLRDTPIITFINKLDREIRDPYRGTRRSVLPNSVLRP